MLQELRYWTGAAFARGCKVEDNTLPMGHHCLLARNYYSTILLVKELWKCSVS